MTPQSHLDTILIERSQLGDIHAFDILLDNHRAKAYSYALKLTHHVEDASDVVAEAFIRVHRAIGRFRANSSFSTWMYKILRNCFLDSHKRNRVNVVSSLDAMVESETGPLSMQPISDSESAFETAARAGLSEQVRGFLNELPANQREMLRMYYEEELTYREMALRLKTPAGTIKSRLHRAKLNLKSLMQKDEQQAFLAGWSL